MFDKVTREELEEKLKTLKGTMPNDPEQKEFAMCYSMAYAGEQISFSYKCAKCGKQEEYIENVYSSTDITKLEKIIDLVEKIKELGHEAEVVFCCPDCNEEEEVINVIFKFKTENDENYFETSCFNIDYYKISLEFLDGKLVYENWKRYYSANQINQIINKMLWGIDIDEKKEKTIFYELRVIREKIEPYCSREEISKIIHKISDEEKEEIKRLGNKELEEFLIKLKEKYSNKFVNTYTYSCASCHEQVVICEKIDDGKIIGYSIGEKECKAEEIETIKFQIELIKIVDEIKKLGYEAEILFSCPKCNNFINGIKSIFSKNKRKVTFRFKNKESGEYIESHFDILDNYEICLKFLEDDLIYKKWKFVYSEDEINKILHKMLGVNVDE